MPDAEMSKSILSYIFSHQVILENSIKKLEFVGEEMKILSIYRKIFRLVMAVL